MLHRMLFSDVYWRMCTGASTHDGANAPWKK